MAYESPIELFENVMDPIIESIKNAKDEAITAKISEAYGVSVNKEELKKALAYDRGQYEKGYADAMAAMSETVNELNRLKSLEFHGDNYENDYLFFAYHEMNGVHTITVYCLLDFVTKERFHFTLSNPMGHDEFVAWCNNYTMTYKEDGSDEDS